MGEGRQETGTVNGGSMEGGWWRGRSHDDEADATVCPLPLPSQPPSPARAEGFPGALIRAFLSSATEKPKAKTAE